MGTSNPNSKSTYNLLGGLRRLINARRTGVIGTLNLQGSPKPEALVLRRNFSLSYMGISENRGP